MRHSSHHCRARLRLVGEDYIATGNHSHAPDGEEIDLMEAEAWCKQEARVTRKTFQAIFTEAVER